MSGSSQSLSDMECVPPPRRSQGAVSSQSNLIQREERKWNRMSEKMSGFHEWFKQECRVIVGIPFPEVNTLYRLADGSFASGGLSLLHYLETAKAMNHHLTMHHTIEERYVFPILAKKMPQFAEANNGAHIVSHQGIHEGLVKLEKLVDKWTDEPLTYSPKEMRECLDSFRDVLFQHLDEEVEDLRGENLKKYFTLQEVAALPI